MKKKILSVFTVIVVLVATQFVAVTNAEVLWTGTPGLDATMDLQIFGIGGVRPDQTTGKATFRALIGRGVTQDERYEKTPIKDATITVYDSIGSKVIADYENETPIAVYNTTDPYQFDENGSPEYQQYRNAEVEIEGFVGRDRDLFFVSSKEGYESRASEGFIFPVNTYTVTFVSNGGTLIDSQYNLLIDSHADEPMVPQKEGYEFDGWYRDDSFEETSRWDFEFDTIQGNTTLYGKWRVVEVPIQMFTVTYQDGSDNESYFVNQIYDVAEGTTTPAYLGIPEREGYTFVGWSPEVANVVTQNVDYRAQWVSKSVPIQTFTVTYLDGSNNESFFVNQMYDVAEGTMTPHYVGTPKREGYTFAGWSPEVADVVTQDVEYIAQWQKEPVKPVEENREESSVESLPLTGTPHNSVGVLTMSSGAVLYLISVLKRKRNDLI